MNAAPEKQPEPGQAILVNNVFNCNNQPHESKMFLDLCDILSGFVIGLQYLIVGIRCPLNI